VDGSWGYGDITSSLGPFQQVVISDDGRRIATLGEDASVIVWQKDTAGAWKGLLLGAPFGSTAIAFSSDGHKVLVEDEGVVVYDLNSILDRRERGGRRSVSDQTSEACRALGAHIVDDESMDSAMAPHAAFSTDDLALSPALASQGLRSGLSACETQRVGWLEGVLAMLLPRAWWSGLPAPGAP
jgi:hypothetical protein